MKRTYWTAKDTTGHLWMHDIRRTRREVIDNLIRDGIAPTIRHLPRAKALRVLRRFGWRVVRVRIVEVLHG